MKLARGSKSSLFLWAALVLYAGVLVKVILFKNPGALQVLLVSGERMPLSFRMQSSNFMPFRTILHYAQGNPNMRVALQNLVGNIRSDGCSGAGSSASLPEGQERYPDLTWGQPVLRTDPAVRGHRAV